MNKYITKQEIWKDITDFEGYYQVSNLGRVRSLDREILYNRGQTPYLAKRNGRVLKPTTSNAYCEVTLTVGYKKEYKLIHRLVAETFIPNPYNKPQVNHIDENKLNNRVDNLEWVTALENQQHALTNGARPYGINSYNSKIDREDCKKILKLFYKYKLNAEEIAEVYNCSAGLILNIKDGKTWHFDDKNIVLTREKLLKYKPSGNSKFNEKDVEEILMEHYIKGKAKSTLAKEYKCGRTTIGRIFSGDFWLYKNNEYLQNLLDSYL